MPINDLAADTYVQRALDTFEYHREKGLSLHESYHLTLDSFCRSFESIVRDANNDPERAQREVVKAVGFPPDPRTLDAQTASEHLESIAQAQSTYLNAYGIATHETTPHQA